MNAPLAVEDIVAHLSSRYGKAEPFGRSRILRFGSSLVCSINYSKLLSGHKYFFGLSKEVVAPRCPYPETKFGDFVLLVCGNADNTLVLPRPLVIEFMRDVSTRRIDVFFEDGSYILQTTKHPKLNVTEFLNAFPKQSRVGEPAPNDDALVGERPDRLHLKAQWALIQLGRAEGCSVWVPPGDRSLSYQRQPLVNSTLNRLPNFGFDENTRRIVQNIDVLWLSKNVIRKAFEVESTTSIFSGLLRLNDLVLSQPNNQIDLYIVASQLRRERVYNQMLRPSFQTLIPKCEFLSFEAIQEQMKHLQAFPMDSGARISGLIQGERFKIPEHYAYPTRI